MLSQMREEGGREREREREFFSLKHKYFALVPEPTVF